MSSDDNQPDLIMDQYSKAVGPVVSRANLDFSKYSYIPTPKPASRVLYRSVGLMNSCKSSFGKVETCTLVRDAAGTLPPGTHGYRPASADIYRYGI